MKLDLLYELSCPKPWNEEKERNAYYNALEQIVLADQLGFGTVWEVEHHFLSEFSHSSAPEIFLACVSQRTERIRIGHGVVLLPNPFNYPIRVAERIAALDIMSRGRVEFGTGRSTWYEQAGFNVRPDETRAMWQEALSIIPKMWSSEQFSHKGEHFEIPERNVLPKPIQRPHPPVWVAGTQDESFEIAGRLGIGMLALTIMVPVEELERRIAMYRKASENVEPITDVVNDRINCLTLVHCAPTTREAIENGAPQAVAWYLRTVAALFAPPEGGEIGLRLRLRRARPAQPRGFRPAAAERGDARDRRVPPGRDRRRRSLRRAEHRRDGDHRRPGAVPEEAGALRRPGPQQPDVPGPDRRPLARGRHAVRRPARQGSPPADRSGLAAEDSHARQDLGAQ